MILKRIVISSLIVGGSIIIGCAGPSMLDQNWGRSVETARYSQTLNPEAEKNLEPVEGLDGKSAQNTMEAYQKGFMKQEKSSGYDIKVTGIGMKK